MAGAGAGAVVPPPPPPLPPRANADDAGSAHRAAARAAVATVRRCAASIGTPLRMGTRPVSALDGRDHHWTLVLGPAAPRRKDKHELRFGYGCERWRSWSTFPVLSPRSCTTATAWRSRASRT